MGKCEEEREVERVEGEVDEEREGEGEEVREEERPEGESSREPLAERRFVVRARERGERGAMILFGDIERLDKAFVSWMREEEGGEEGGVKERSGMDRDIQEGVRKKIESFWNTHKHTHTRTHTHKYT